MEPTISPLGGFDLKSTGSLTPGSTRKGNAHPADEDALPRRPKVALGFRYRGDIMSLAILLCLALGVRLLYQHESVVNKPLRADAGKYFRAAYNLRVFGIHSEEKRRPNSEPPQSRTDLSPAYPLFLTLFLDAKTTAEFEERVLIVQAILGTLTTACTFLLARVALGLPWAILAGVLTAVSPHLIAMDGYLLTESLFTFVTVLGALILALSWRAGWASLTLLASLLLAVSARVRAVGYALPFFLATVFLFDAHAPRLSRPFLWARQIAMVLLGFFSVVAAHREFVKVTVTHESSFLPVPHKFAHAPKEAPRKRVVFSSPWTYLKRSIHPPNFFIKNESHVRVRNPDRDWKRRWQGSFWDHPLAYLKWNLGARLFYIWHWDNAYNGDVYIYPMKRAGFRVNAFLGMIHGAMHIVHWPLYVLSLAAPIVFLLRWRRGTSPVDERLLLVPTVVFVYFLAVLSLLSWLPRYTIPARPYSYILAAASLSWLVSRLRSVSMGGRGLKPGGRKNPKTIKRKRRGQGAGSRKRRGMGVSESATRISPVRTLPRMAQHNALPLATG